MVLQLFFSFLQSAWCFETLCALQLSKLRLQGCESITSKPPITAPIVVQSGCGGGEAANRARISDNIRLWSEEEMATTLSEPNRNGSTPEENASTDETIEEEDDLIPQHTSRVHTNFSSSSLSLVSTGTTSSSGIYGDVKPNLLSTNSGSLGDIDNANNNARSSFGLFEVTPQMEVFEVQNYRVKRIN